MFDIKKIFIISLIIFAPSPVLAAAVVPGSMPDVQPLQPAPVGQNPDYSRSINTQPQAPLPGSNNIANPDAQVSSSTPDGREDDTTRNAATQNESGGAFNIWVAIALALALIVLVGIVYFGPGKKPLK